MDDAHRTHPPDQGPLDVVLQYQEALQRMGGDREVYLEISRYFASTLPDSLQAIKEALDEGRPDTARRLAHSLKSNCATVGAEDLRAQCHTLELLSRNEELDKARLYHATLTPQLLCLRDKLLAL